MRNVQALSALRARSLSLWATPCRCSESDMVCASEQGYRYDDIRCCGFHL